MARCLAENGAAKVYIVGRREANLKEAAASHSQYASHHFLYSAVNT